MKFKRHTKIIELINENVIETQEELLEKLKKCGYNVTQATISRDIRQLGIFKATSSDGKLRYSTKAQEAVAISDRLVRIFKDSVVSIDYAQNMVVIKTFTGMAMAVAAAVDAMKNIEILGSIAGDDTVFCVVRSQEKAIELIESFKSLMKK